MRIVHNYSIYPTSITITTKRNDIVAFTLEPFQLINNNNI